MSAGMGFLVGMADADARNNSASQSSDLATMRAELADKMRSVVYQQSFKLAAAAVHETMIDELEDAARGLPSATRLSDPKNVDGRNLAYAENAAALVNRLSGQRMSMSRLSIDNMCKARGLK